MKMFFKLICENLFTKLKPINLKNVASPSNSIYTSAVMAGKINRMKDRTALLRTVVKKEEGTRGEQTVDLDSVIQSQQFQRFPDIGLPDRLFEDTPYKDLHISNIRVSKNNTIVTLNDSKGKTLAINSCGKEGYKNCRKGTNIAGQATAITLAKMCLQKGFQTVRVVVKGLGPGRTSSIKGIQMAGLDIVSVTDAPVSDNPPRARKARRI